MKYKRIVFVCTGNTCRSPMAEALFRHRAEQLWKPEDRPEITSRGLSVYRDDQLNPRAYLTLIGHGLSLDGFKSRQLSAEDLNEDTLVLTMTENHSRQIRCIFGDNWPVYPLARYVEAQDYDGTEECEDRFRIGQVLEDIPDPYGKPLESYEECYKALDYLTERLAAEIKAMEQ